MCCCSENAPEGYQIIIGTSAQGRYDGTLASITTTSSRTSAWIGLEKPQPAEKIRSIQPGSFGSPRTKKRFGAVFLAQQGSGDDPINVCNAVTYNAAGGHIDNYILQTGRLGNVHDVFSSLNPWG